MSIPVNNNTHTLNNVTVGKDALLKTLKENLDAHNEVFNAATQSYYESLRAEFEDKLEKAKKLAKVFKAKLEKVTEDDVTGGLSDFTDFQYFKTKKPVSYESSYKAAIRKIELSVHDEFTLSNDDFEKYVLNNWEWSANFVNTASSYVGTGAFSGALVSGLQKFVK